MVGQHHASLARVAVNIAFQMVGLSKWPLRLQAFVEAVHAGDIFWHAMPFNTQVEMFDAPLLQYAIELTHELDAKFGQKPKRAMSQVWSSASRRLLSALILIHALWTLEMHFSLPCPATLLRQADNKCCGCIW